MALKYGFDELITMSLEKKIYKEENEAENKNTNEEKEPSSDENKESLDEPMIQCEDEEYFKENNLSLKLKELKNLEKYVFLNFLIDFEIY